MTRKLFSRSKIHSFLAALMLLLLLAACSSTPGPVVEPATLTFLVVPLPWLPDRSGDYERLATIFHESHPNVSVQIKSVGFEELPRGLADADLLTDPEWGVDVVLTSVDLLPELVARGLLRDLGPAVEGNLTLEAQDFYPPALDLLRWQGGLYGLPAELDSWVMFYNQDLFDAAGLPYPSDDWRWDDFLETARALEKPGLFPFGSWGAQVTPWVYQNGGTLVDDPATPGKATLEDPATVAAIRWYVDLALLEGVMPTPAALSDYAVSQGHRQTIVSSGDAANEMASQAQADLGQAVASGDVGIWMGWLSQGGGYWERWDFRWGAAPLPAGGQAATLVSLRSYFITAHSGHFEEALRWVDYLTRQPPLYGGLPARRSIAASDAFRNQVRPEVVGALDACLAVLESGVLLPEALDWQVTQWLQGPLFAVLAGEKNLEEALAEAQQQAEQALGQK